MDRTITRVNRTADDAPDDELTEEEILLFVTLGLI